MPREEHRHHRGKEIKEGLRNRWVLATTLLLAALALSLTFLGSAPTGNVGAGALDVVVVSLSSLTIFLLPLIALLISHDAVVGEMERGTMILLLSYPVGRGQVILGKFCGHVLILAFATVIGYGAAAAALAMTGASVLAASWYAFASMLGTSIMLGAVVRRDRISDQQPGPRSRHRRGHFGRHLAADGAGVRHGAARHSGGRSGAHDLPRPSSKACCFSIRPICTG